MPGKMDVGLLLLMLTASFTLPHGTAGEQLTEDKVNLGWPKFFNPEKAILRKQEDALKRKKASEADKSSLLSSVASSGELLVDNRLANVIKDKDRLEWPDLEDFKIKDELRGTLIPLTAAGPVSAQWQQQVSRDHLTDILAELSNLTDVYHTLSETSSDGLRLATPLFRRRFSPSLGKYGTELTFYAGTAPTSCIYYGNWWGLLLFYGLLASHIIIHKANMAWLIAILWLIIRSEATCVNRVCECDVEAALCLASELREAEGEELREAEGVEHGEAEGEEHGEAEGEELREPEGEELGEAEGEEHDETEGEEHGEAEGRELSEPEGEEHDQAEGEEFGQ
ncbi:uncharacterized protein LOC108669015 [Hyalella azteca]|uniref:Uncharacterized protein LOC108669015 n=1 Tax=Hyalella azteca TaxID=294128 RepID=A0A8B7NDV7_HYAAZ|nr:uncharacterized protein LOC108669015 [Hyalella azteca]